jgi:pullulanase/glycogen debranching enzyme
MTWLTRYRIRHYVTNSFTRHPNSGVDEQKRGTFAGLIEKIPYLQQLGVTAVELLPTSVPIRFLPR